MSDIATNLIQRTLFKKAAEIVVTLIGIILVGFIMGILWALIGLIFSVTIIGIPLGKKCFDIAGYAINSTKHKKVAYNYSEHKMANIIWTPFGILMFAITFVFLAILSPFMIIFPNLRRKYKLLKMGFMPFGTTITRDDRRAKQEEIVVEATKVV